MSCKWLVIGALGLSGVFTSCGKGHGDNEQRPVRNDPYDYVEDVPRTLDAALDIINVETKESLIYRDSLLEYRADYNKRAEAYLDANGREVRDGEDFAVHIGLFAKGGISLLIAAGPHAGTRLEFFPVDLTTESGSSVTYSRLAREAFVNGRRAVMEIMPDTAQFSVTRSMKRADHGAVDVSLALSQTNPWFTKTMIDGGEASKAFSLKGKPWKEDQFTITIWNGDSYSLNLKTGAYTFNSAFLYHPNYLQDYERTDIELTQNDIPIVRGVLPIAQPKIKPVTAPGL